MDNTCRGMQQEIWLGRNSIKNNEAFICQILMENGIESYNFSPNGYGDFNLFFGLSGKRYMLQLDSIRMEYALLEENLASNPAYKQRYHLIERFNEFDEVLRFIKHRGNYNKKQKGVDADCA